MIESSNLLAEILDNANFIYKEPVIEATAGHNKISIKESSTYQDTWYDISFIKDELTIEAISIFDSKDHKLFVTIKSKFAEAEEATKANRIKDFLEEFKRNMY